MVLKQVLVLQLNAKCKSRTQVHGQFTRSTAFYVKRKPIINRQINQSFQHMTKFAIILSICVLMLGMLFSIKNEIRAQNVVRQGKVFVQQSNRDSIKTDYEYQDKDGNKYPIYLSRNGKAYIWVYSKKKQKWYPRYLPKVTQMLQEAENGK